MHEVQPLSDHPGQYAKGLRSCKNKKELREFLFHWTAFAYDAGMAVEQDTFIFSEYKKGLVMESSGKFAGEEWGDKYGAIIMPNVLFQVSMVAQQYKVPWGLAFIRMEETGLLKRDGDIYVVT